MKHLRIKIVTLIIFLISSCKQNEQNGIIIADTLYAHQNYSGNKEMRSLIKLTLEKNPYALIELKNFWCGGAAGCYDLGFIITQIIYKMGEPDFLTLLKKIDKENRNGVQGLIRVGLEYGDHNGNGKMDGKRIDTEFPYIYRLLNE